MSPKENFLLISINKSARSSIAQSFRRKLLLYEKTFSWRKLCDAKILQTKSRAKILLAIARRSPAPHKNKLSCRFRMKNSRENLNFPPMHRPHQSFHFHTKSFSEFSTKRKLLKHCLESFLSILIDSSELYLLKLGCFHCCKIEFPLNLWFLNFFRRPRYVLCLFFLTI